jgi:hypothetical protein
MRLAAEACGNGNRIRVVSVESPPGWERALVIEEHDSYLSDTDGARSMGRGDLGSSQRRCDVFVLVNRAAQRGEVVRVDELGSTVMAGQVLGFRRLYIPSADGEEGWRRDAVIVKVRFQRERQIVLPFEAEAPVVVRQR